MQWLDLVVVERRGAGAARGSARLPVGHFAVWQRWSMDPKTTIVPHPDFAGTTHAANLADKHSSHRMRLESASTDAGEDLDKE